MIRRLRNIDRQVAIGVLVLVSATLVLTIGAIGVFVAMSNDSVNLPEQGTIQEIIDEGVDEPAPAATAQPDLPPPPPPIRMVIPRLYIDAPIVTKGITADYYPEVPERPDQVAWYPPVAPNFGAYPGQSSNAVFAGHVDWQTREGAPIAGVFYRLREMKIGDAVEVVLEDGTKLEYRVTGNVATPYNDPSVGQVMGHTDGDVITMITCGGTWVSNPRSSAGGNYSHRIIVRAERVQALAEALPDEPGG